MNNFDINLFLPMLFYTILAQGRGRARRVNKPEDILQYIDALAQNSNLQGFDDWVGRRVLERLVLITLITTAVVERSLKYEQITPIIPYMLLAHKPEFPVAAR